MLKFMANFLIATLQLLNVEISGKQFEMPGKGITGA